MTATPDQPSPEQLALLGKTIRDVARIRRLSPDEADDFAQTVHLRFLERGYDILHRFEGRCSLRTYLVVVINRMLLDWRNSMYGKWRPSRAAESLGAHAIDLERLQSRDGCTVEEAVEMLQTKKGAPSAPALRRLTEQLPIRTRRRTVSDDALRALPGPRFEDPIELHDKKEAERRMRRALVAALRGLSPEDRWLIRERYHRGRSIRAAALALHADPKAIYRRYARMLRSLRRALCAELATVQRQTA